MNLSEVVNEEIALELTADHIWYEKDETFTKKGLKTPFGLKKAQLFSLEKIKKDYDDGKLIATTNLSITESLGEKVFVRVGLISIAGKKLKKERIGFAASEGAGKRICTKLLTLNKQGFEFKLKDEQFLKTLFTFYNEYSEQIKDTFFEAAITARTIRDELKVGGQLETLKPACEYFTSIK